MQKSNKKLVASNENKTKKGGLMKNKSKGNLVGTTKTERPQAKNSTLKQQKISNNTHKNHMNKNDDSKLVEKRMSHLNVNQKKS